MAYRLLENLLKREFENLAGDRLLEPVPLITVYPDPFQATSIPKTVSFLTATTTIKTYDPFSATVELHGTQV